jgi:hypothetical protein
VWVSYAARYRQDIIEEKRPPKKWRAKTGKSTVSTNCKAGVKTNVVVFAFATPRISKLTYTASFNKCLACETCKKGIF